jgi:hypothetical protein
MSPPPTIDPPAYEKPTVTPIGKDAMIAAMNKATRAILGKPGWQTTEFWFAVASAVVPWLAATVPAPISATITAAAGAVYGISRAITKIRTNN